MIPKNSFITIQSFMVTELDLKGNDLLLYALIYGFTQDRESKFTGSLKYITEWLNISKPTAMESLRRLIDKQLIIKSEIYVNNIKYCAYKLRDSGKETLPGGMKETLPGGGKDSLLLGGKETLPNNIVNDNIDLNIKGKKENQEFSKTVNEIFTSVLKHFPENVQPKNETSKNKWKDEIRKIIEIDKRPPHEIEFIVKWARNDSFWKGNFLSILKLRKNNREGITYYNVFLTKTKDGNLSNTQQKQLSIYPDKDYSSSWD